MPRQHSPAIFDMPSSSRHTVTMCWKGRQMSALLRLTFTLPGPSAFFAQSAPLVVQALATEQAVMKCIALQSLVASETEQACGSLNGSVQLALLGSAGRQGSREGGCGFWFMFFNEQRVGWDAGVCERGLRAGSCSTLANFVHAGSAILGPCRS